MTIINTLSTYEISDFLYKDEFATWGNNRRLSNIMAKFLDEYFEDETIELDVIAIRCDFSIYDNKDVAEENGGDIVAEIDGYYITQD